MPDACFDSVAIDFIGLLPEEDGKDMIMTITDTLGADICLVPTHSKWTTAQVAVALFDNWYCENGLMLHLISDRDALFTSELWAAFIKLTGVKLKMLTSYHPKTDGASERTNKTLVQLIHYHVNVNQKGWLAQLPRVHFAIMNTVNTSTGFSPFQLKSGHSPRIIPPLIPLPDNASEAEISAAQIVKRIELDVQAAQDSLMEAKVRQAYHANQDRSPEKPY